ncbi:class I SAM-dependent methyltransferase [Pelomonas sp. KK5]|uniref:class I SAM-dependent methyltransferase n=1 Tax=Pelomonas sp. KK5 TaxID=1855730 RepID=UPI00097C12A6|nr:class I SAM-dependent methyltransferase [Pelomonas sp. KK5]
MGKTLLAVMLLAGVSGVAAAADATLQAAVAGTWRAPENRARDVWRHPVETLGFFGIRQDQTVVELVPGGGWYTEILATYLGEKGRLLVAGADPASPGGQRQQQRFAARPAVYGAVKVGMLDAKAGRFDFGPPGSADLVLTFRNTHNWVELGEAQTRAVYKAAFDALKPGGVLGVTDHRLPESRPQDATASTGYLHQSYVVKLAESVGFKLAGSSEINANPKDTADHEGGVWALPPTWTNKDKDREKYAAIGESDRMTLKFVKP